MSKTSKAAKILGAVALTAVVASPAVLANSRFSAVFGAFTTVETLSTGVQFVPGAGSPVTLSGSGRADFFSLLERQDPASPN